MEKDHHQSYLQNQSKNTLQKEQSNDLNQRMNSPKKPNQGNLLPTNNYFQSPNKNLNQNQNQNQNQKQKLQQNKYHQQQKLFINQNEKVQHQDQNNIKQSLVDKQAFNSMINHHINKVQIPIPVNYHHHVSNYQHSLNQNHQKEKNKYRSNQNQFQHQQNYFFDNHYMHDPIFSQNSPKISAKNPYNGIVSMINQEALDQRKIDAISLSFDQINNYKFYQEHNKVLITAKNLNDHVRELIKKKKQLDVKIKKLDKDMEFVFQAKYKDQISFLMKDTLGNDQNKRKRSRRAANQINRGYSCNIQICDRSYGIFRSQASLIQHMKLKHPQINYIPINKREDQDDQSGKFPRKRGRKRVKRDVNSNEVKNHSKNQNSEEGEEQQENDQSFENSQEQSEQLSQQINENSQHQVSISQKISQTIKKSKPYKQKDNVQDRPQKNTNSKKQKKQKEKENSSFTINLRDFFEWG